jgi:hypothetical protein
MLRPTIELNNLFLSLWLVPAETACVSKIYFWMKQDEIQFGRLNTMILSIS